MLRLIICSLLTSQCGFVTTKELDRFMDEAIAKGWPPPTERLEDAPLAVVPDWVQKSKQSR